MVCHCRCLDLISVTVAVLCPQVLQDSYNGFVDRRIVDDYVNYADVLFANFGDKVKDWMTFNEPWITCALQVGHAWLVCTNTMMAA